MHARHALLALVLVLAACAEGPATVELADNRVCPDWSAPSIAGFENLPSSNFGCATRTNLRAMVANPLDLVAGRQPGPADADTGVLAVERHRTDRVKGSGSGGQKSQMFVPLMAGPGGQGGNEQ